MKLNNIHWDEIEIDRRIIPLFRSNIELKKKELLKKNNYDLNSIRPKKLKLINDVIPLNVKLVKIYDLINNYSLIINNLYLRNDILKALPSEDRLNIKISLDNISLKLKSFEPIFSFNSLTYLDYFYKVLGNKKLEFTKAQEKKEKEWNNSISLYRTFYSNMRKQLNNPNLKNDNKTNKFINKDNDILNLGNIINNNNNKLIKQNVNKNINLKKNKNFTNLNLVKHLGINIFKPKSKLDLKLSPLLLPNNKKNRKLLSFIKNIIKDKNKINKKDIKIIKAIFMYLHTQKRKYKNLKNIYTDKNKFKNNLFADKFSKKRLGPKPSQINKVWYSKVYTHSLKTPVDVSNFFYHRKIENNIAKNNPNYNFWFNHTFKYKKNTNNSFNKFINLRNTDTNTSYNTISNPLNYKIKNTLLNSFKISKNFKNKNMLNKFYKFKTLNNNKKYFLWNLLYKNSIISKKYNKINNIKNINKINNINKYKNISLNNNNDNNLDFNSKWNNLNIITRLIILWELKKNSHFIQLFNYFNKKKVNKYIYNNFNNFFYKFLYVNHDKNKFFDSIKVNKFIKPMKNYKNLDLNIKHSHSINVIQKNDEVNKIKFIKSNKNKFYMFYTYPRLRKIFLIETINKNKFNNNKIMINTNKLSNNFNNFKIRLKYLQYLAFFKIRFKKFKNNIQKFNQKNKKKLIEIKKAQLLNKKKINIHLEKLKVIREVE